MQVNITKIEVLTKTSAKTGKPYKQIEMFTKEHGSKKLTKFVDKDDKALYWRAGDVVSITEVPNGNFLNFTVEEMKTNANSGAALRPQPPFYVPPEYQHEVPNVISTVKQPPQSTINSTAPEYYGIPKVDRNYELLLRIARQVGVDLTEQEINDSLGF